MGRRAVLQRCVPQATYRRCAADRGAVGELASGDCAPQGDGRAGVRGLCPARRWASWRHGDCPPARRQPSLGTVPGLMVAGTRGDTDLSALRLSVRPAGSAGGVGTAASPLHAISRDLLRHPVDETGRGTSTVMSTRRRTHRHPACRPGRTPTAVRAPTVRLRGATPVPSRLLERAAHGTSASIFAAQMKSLSDSPLIACVV